MIEVTIQRVSTKKTTAGASSTTNTVLSCSLQQQKVASISQLGGEILISSVSIYPSNSSILSQGKLQDLTPDSGV